MLPRKTIALALTLSLPTLTGAISARYVLPPAARVWVEADPDPSTPATFTLVGHVRASTFDLKNVELAMTVPAGAQVLEGTLTRKGSVTKGQELSLTLRVRLEAGVKQAMVGLGASFDYPAREYLRHVQDNKEKLYDSVPMRDYLVRQIRSRLGRRASLGRVTMLEVTR